jgi:hypothetical protein
VRRTHALILVAVVVGLGLLASSVQGLAKLDGRLAASDRARDAVEVKQERPAGGRHHCPWRDDRRS